MPACGISDWAGLVLPCLLNVITQPRPVLSPCLWKDKLCMLLALSVLWKCLKLFGNILHISPFLKEFLQIRTTCAAHVVFLTQGV